MLLSISAVCDVQVLASTESATSGQLAISLYISALPGRLGRVELVLDGPGWNTLKQRNHY